jgi:hypothetical protein
MRKSNRALTPILLLVFVSLAGAQDLPDPGRRLSQREQDMDPEKLLDMQRRAAQPSDVFKPDRHRDPQICERARLNKQLACGAPNSFKSRSLQCTEAHAFLDQNCY